MKGQIDPFSNIILATLSLVSVAWILIPQSILVLIGVLFAIVITLIYSNRVSKLGTDETPISDTLIALSGVIVALQLSSVYFGIEFLNKFGLNHAVISLLIGSIFKLFLLDKVVLELIIQIKTSLIYIFDWSTNNFLNMVRLIFLAFSIGFFSFKTYFDSLLSIDFSLGLAYLFASIVFLLSSFNSWGERYGTARGIAIFSLIIMLLQDYEISVTLIKISLRILLLSIIIFSISIPRIVDFFKNNFERLTQFINDYLLSTLRLFSFISSWFVLQLAPSPLNVIVFAVLLIFSLWIYISSFLSFVYHTTISTYKLIIHQLKTKPLRIARTFSGIIGFSLLINSIFLQGYYLSYFGLGFLIFASSGYIIKYTKTIYKWLGDLISEMINAFKTLYHFILENPFQFIRTTSGIVAIISYYYSLSSGNTVLSYLAIFLAIVAFSKIIQDVIILLYKSILNTYLSLSKWILEDPLLHTRIISGYSSIILFFINIFLGLNSLSIIVGVLLSYALLPYLFDLFKRFVRFIFGNKRLSWQLNNGILSILSFNLLGRTPIFGIFSNQLFGYTFLFLALLPWIYDFMATMKPLISNTLRYFRDHIFVVNKMSAILATVLLFFRKLIPENYLSIFYVSIAILYSLSFDYFILKFIDSLAQGIYGFVYAFLSFFSTILRVLRNIGIWNIITNFVKRLLRLFHSMLKFVYRNIILIVLYLISFIFVLMGLGILIPWVFPPSPIIFAGIKGNFLVSFIVTIFLISLGGLGFREITERRSQFQLEVTK